MQGDKLKIHCTYRKSKRKQPPQFMTGLAHRFGIKGMALTSSSLTLAWLVSKEAEF